MNRSDLPFYIVIGLVFEPLCLAFMQVGYLAEGPMHIPTLRAKSEIAVCDRAIDLFKHDGRALSSRR